MTQWRAQAMPTRALLSPTYSEARGRKENALATLREIQVRVRQGELVERSAVEDRVFRVGRQIRDSILNVASRVSGICAAETDQQKIHAVLSRELTQTLEGLARG